jgi:hypothetical protein
VSIPQVAQALAIERGVVRGLSSSAGCELATSSILIFEMEPLPALLAAVAEVRRFCVAIEEDGLTIFVDWLTRVALRTVPVKVRSACLKF